jgi:hypothetical protein
MIQNMTQLDAQIKTKSIIRTDPLGAGFGAYVYNSQPGLRGGMGEWGITLLLGGGLRAAGEGSHYYAALRQQHANFNPGIGLDGGGTTARGQIRRQNGGFTGWTL